MGQHRTETGGEREVRRHTNLASSNGDVGEASATGNLSTVDIDDDGGKGLIVGEGHAVPLVGGPDVERLDGGLGGSENNLATSDIGLHQELGSLGLTNRLEGEQATKVAVTEHVDVEVQVSTTNLGGGKAHLTGTIGGLEDIVDGGEVTNVNLITDAT
jgi:hypothetical protein